ncbi:hypothetical protein PV327_006546 [Microctonus hyperodae]|uniref:EGF-like domain-containing protein n=1 Tax=Microctonus hyperodae TaxID=165561 RepID=A0AA39F4K1_MICHY|nr:hypothetical protein PV327_006546 [Microctonus hyperodae]
MNIPGGVLVAGGAARCLYSATGMLRFLARLSGRRRHVRRGFGGAPGDATTGAVSLLSVEPSSSSSCCFTTSTTTTTSSSSSSNEAVSKDIQADQSIVVDSIRINENNLDLDDIRLRKCYLRCRRNIQSGSSHQDTMNELSTCTEERLMGVTTMSINTTTTTTTASTRAVSGTTNTMQKMEDDSLSRIADLRDESTTAMTSRRERRGFLDEINNNSDARVSSTITNKSNNSESSSIWLKNDENSRSTGVARYRRRRQIPSYLATLLVISYTLFGITEACSSRSTPKPRPPAPTPRPNITFHMYTCPPDYAEWYCLNGATCFTVKIQESLLYNCLCANGFIGQRCEFKDLDGSYLPSRQRVMLETASIAGGATIAVFLVVIICIAAYINCKRKQKELRTSTCGDTVDGPVRDPERRPFSNRNRPIMTFMAKNSNCTVMSNTVKKAFDYSPDVMQKYEEKFLIGEIY